MLGIIGIVILSIIEPAIRSVIIIYIGILLGKYLSTCAHELGHFFTGRVVGFDVKEVIIGEKSKLFAVNLFGTTFTFNLGFGGLNSVNISKHQKLKQRLIIFILGGVTFQLITIICIYLLLGLGNENNLFMPLIYILILMWDVTRALLPREYYFSGIIFPSDGLRIKQILNMKEFNDI